MIEISERPVEAQVGALDAELLAELRRNTVLRKEFLRFPSALKVLDSNIHSGTLALLSECKSDMEAALRRLRGNRHWNPEIGPNAQAQPTDSRAADGRSAAAHC